MQRNRKTEQARVEEEEADDADECLAIFIVELGASWEQRRNMAGSTRKLSIAR
jgi:hypothetical protein